MISHLLKHNFILETMTFHYYFASFLRLRCAFSFFSLGVTTPTFNFHSNLMWSSWFRQDAMPLWDEVIIITLPLQLLHWSNELALIMPPKSYFTSYLVGSWVILDEPLRNDKHWIRAALHSEKSLYCQLSRMFYTNISGSLVIKEKWLQ